MKWNKHFWYILPQCGGIASVSIFYIDVWQGINPCGYIPPVPLLVASAEHGSEPVSNVHAHRNFFRRDGMQVWGKSATANQDNPWRQPVFTWVSVSISSAATHHSYCCLQRETQQLGGWPLQEKSCTAGGEVLSLSCGLQSLSVQE